MKGAQDETCATTNGGDINFQTKLDFYKNWFCRVNALGDDEQAEYWGECFVEELKNGNQNRLHIAVLLKEDLPFIQSLYESDPDNLNEVTLYLACKFGASEGVIPYLAEKNPDYITSDCLNQLSEYGHQYNAGDISKLALLNPEAVWTESEIVSGMYPIGAAMYYHVADSAVRTLVEVWPASVITTQTFDGYGYDEDCKGNPLQKCIEMGYSNDLFEFMMEKIPPVRDFRMNGLELCSKDLLWIERVFDRCQGSLTCGLSTQWVGAGFHDFLGKCFFQMQEIDELDLTIPEPISYDAPGDGVDKAKKSMQEFNRKYCVQQQQQQQLENPQIEVLTLRFGHKAYCELLYLLPFWPCLCELDVDVGDYIGPSMTALCMLITNGRLTHLCIRSTESATKSSRKRTSSSAEVVKSPLQPLFDALATNETITSLEIDPIPEGDENLCCDLLVEVLKQNSTLEEVDQLIPTSMVVFMSIVARGDSRPFNPLSDLSWSQHQLVHYLQRNRCGRKVVRDDATTLREFVSVLASTGERLGGSEWYQKRKYLMKCDCLPLCNLYGLLREGINIWS